MQSSAEDLQIWWLVDADFDEAVYVDECCHGDMSWTREDLSIERSQPSRTAIGAKGSDGEIVSWAIYSRSSPSIEVVRTSHLDHGSAEKIYTYIMSRLAYSGSNFFEAYELIPDRFFETRCKLLSDLGWIAARTFRAEDSPLHWPEAEPGVEMIFRRGW